MRAREAIHNLEDMMNASVIGQEEIVSKFIIGLLADGNILVEGLPGLAKTRVVRAMSDAIECDFSRIQFTSDLLPLDVMGSKQPYMEDGKKYLIFRRGPIFGNIILADEINRAPIKVQAAMLEAMAERQVTVAGDTYELPKLFIVIATQNSLDHEGTFPLAEAQKDRFFMQLEITYVKKEEEFRMIRLIQKERYHEKLPQEKISQEMIFAAQKEVSKVKFSDAIGHYIVDLVYATRFPMQYSKQLAGMIDVGVSPRASLALSQCAQAHAWMRSGDEITVEDVQAVIHDVFRHRLILSEHTQTNGITYNEIIDIILKQVPLPT